MTSSKTIFVIGDAGVLKNQLVNSLQAQGHRIFAFGADASEADLLVHSPGISGEMRVIFTPFEHDEATRLAEAPDALVQFVGNRVKAFLAQAQAALQLMMMQDGGGQLWVCDFDDSFAYHMAVPCCPIAAQARAGAVRSLAKEYSRMRISVNSLLVQPVGDDASAGVFRKAAAGLKSYAMRYKPTPVEDVADLLGTFVGTSKLQFSGNIIGTGTGIVQGHLTA